MLLLLHVVGFTASFLITVRNFSLVTDEGENVLQSNFDRRRLGDRIGTRRLSFKFSALEKHFEFTLTKSYPIFAPDLTIKISGRVSLNQRTSTAVHLIYGLPLCTRIAARIGQRVRGSIAPRSFVIL